ncbi:MAG TPA: RNA methyltransferase [Porphyromonadaceae bacterium]|nr:RNA methyltransferase [Porphyromonadaceae bacterium]
MQQISKSIQKLISSLAYKKYREETGLFIAEGGKLVEELLPYFECELLIASPVWIERREIVAQKVLVVEEKEIERCSLQEYRRDVMALFRIKHWEFAPQELREGLFLGLDSIQDPGNLGTILRVANWFGIKRIIASIETVDVFNPKVVQSSMGAIGKVEISYTNLPSFLAEITALPVYGTSLQGENIYTSSLSASGIILMGNEGKGLSKEVSRYVNKMLYIPPYPRESERIESLNVAVSTSIILSEFRRREG